MTLNLLSKVGGPPLALATRFSQLEQADAPHRSSFSTPNSHPHIYTFSPYRRPSPQFLISPFVSSPPPISATALTSRTTPTASSTPVAMSSRFASTTDGTSSTFDPQEAAAQSALDDGTEALQREDFEGAEKNYKKSVEIKETSIGAFLLILSCLEGDKVQ